jgi:hypothetical protein
MKNLFKKLFARRQPKYGAAIFQQKSWLDKQVEEALYKKSFFLD